MDRLKAGTSRYSILAGFVNSAEFGQVCSKFGIVQGRIGNIPESTPAGWIVHPYKTVDPFVPAVDLRRLGISPSDVVGLGLDCKGKLTSFMFRFEASTLRIEDELLLETPYVLKIFTKDGKRHWITFNTSGLPVIVENGPRKVIKVPAMPEKGFHWPYLLAIPDVQNKAANHRSKRYLMVDINNTGPISNYTDVYRSTRRAMEGRWYHTMATADQLWMPMLMPIFPRPLIGYDHNNEYNVIYTHALDRDSAILHLLIQDPALRRDLEEKFREQDYDLKTFLRIDLQLIAMMDHAIEYLNQHNCNIVKDKVFLYGHSASGTFVDRFANLHPHRVKAVASGATLDDMMLPLKTYKGRDLIFPIGTHDYKKITGRDFNMTSHNQLARLIYMGELDDNDVLPYSDGYGDLERDIILSLWGSDILARAKSLIDLYGKSGGHGMFILDKGETHWMSNTMGDYIIEFFKANRDSSGPVYPIPKDPDQLMYRLFK